MTTPSLNVVSQICTSMVSMHRTAKLALMLAIDLVALPCCFLIAILLRQGGLTQASQYGPEPVLLAAAASVAALSTAGKSVV